MPGPFWARVSGIPSWYHAIKGDRHLWLSQQFEIYGKKVRAAPNVAVFRDPDAYAAIYGAKANVRRSSFYTAFKRKDNESTTLNTIDVAEHASRRKLLSLAFTERMVRAASEFIIKHVDRWDQLLLDEIPDGEWSSTIDFSERIDTLIFDIMGDLSFGRSFDIKEPGENPLKVIPHAIAEYMKFYYPVSKITATSLIRYDETDLA